jgi:hypothetical protein
LIQPTDEQRSELAQAKNEIRDHLRTGIAAASVAILQMPHRVEPRFRTQGSWSYNTCIQPYMMPPFSRELPGYSQYFNLDSLERLGKQRLDARTRRRRIHEGEDFVAHSVVGGVLANIR